MPPSPFLLALYTSDLVRFVKLCVTVWLCTGNLYLLSYEGLYKYLASSFIVSLIESVLQARISDVRHCISKMCPSTGFQQKWFTLEQCHIWEMWWRSIITMDVYRVGSIVVPQVVFVYFFLLEEQKTFKLYKLSSPSGPWFWDSTTCWSDQITLRQSSKWHIVSRLCLTWIAVRFVHPQDLLFSVTITVHETSI